MVVLFLFTALCLACAAAAASPQQKKAEQAKAASSPAGIPEITRVAVIQEDGREPLLRSPLAIAADPRSGDLVVTSFENGEVVIIGRTGALIKRIGKEAGLASPYGVAVDARGRIFVSEVRSGALKILSPSGDLLEEIDLSSAAGRGVAPGRITLDGDGKIYVADLNANAILVLSPAGALLKTIGAFDYLQKVGPVAADRIAAISAQGKGVTLFSKEGTPLRSFGEHGDSPDRNISFPTGFAADSRGRLWVADAFQHRLKVFSMDGRFLFNFGRMEEESGGFFFPVDICFYGKGKLAVLEKGANRIQIFEVADLAGVD